MNGTAVLTEPSDEPKRPKNFDVLIRLRGTQSGVNVLVRETDSFIHYVQRNLFEKYNFVRNTLVEVIKSQKSLLNYTGYYNAFLMGQLSEAEFMTVAQEYTYQPKEINITELACKIKCLFEVTEIDFTASELSDIFQCKYSNILEALDHVSHANLVK